MIERANYSPSGEDITFQGSWRERFMLRRLSRVALRLPEKFDEKGRGGKLWVHGESSAQETIIKLEKNLTGEGDLAAQFTDIVLNRSEANPQLVTNLRADRYVTDDTGDLMGASGTHETFALGDQGNTLSMFGVMHAVSLAVQTVEWLDALEFMASPEYKRNYPQLF